MLKHILNTKGMSILEVMVAAGLAAIVSLGLATMMQNSMAEQKRSLLFNTLKEQKTRIEFLMRDQNSWNQTMNCTNVTVPACAVYNNLATFNTLRANSATTEVPYTTPIKLILMDASGAVTMNLLGPANMTGNGFTDAGVACTTFNANAGAGNDNCPISYRLLMGADCPGAGPCVNPQLKLVGRLVFNPSPNGRLIKYQTLISQVAGSDISDTVTAGKYDAVVKRTTNRIDRTFTLTSYIFGSGTDCAGRGAGICTPGGAAGNLTVHPLPASAGYSIADTNGLVSTNGAGISFLEKGLYSCIISVNAFATQAFLTDFYNYTTSTSIASAVAYAGYWSQGVAVINAKFNVTEAVPGTPDEYIVRQTCQTQPPVAAGGDPNIAKCSLGMAATSYPAGGTPIINISCFKSDSPSEN